MNKKITFPLILCLCFSLLVGCEKKESNQVIIYSNADEEAQIAIEKVLDENGYKGKYVFQTYGTNELGGKLLGEGKAIEADMITMSSYYIDSAQQENEMFVDCDFGLSKLQDISSYQTPILSIEGSIIINTKELEKNNLPKPTSIKDLADPIYEGAISVVDMSGSSTGWLLVQALLDTYGEKETKKILTGIIKNAGPHLETSGSGPLKKARAGEVAIAFGLRHQAVADKASGLPIDYIDPSEGNFALTESIAIVKRSEQKTTLTKAMAKCIMEKARKDIMVNYPIPLYVGEEVDTTRVSNNQKRFSKPLTTELLQEHLDLFEACRLQAQE